MTEPRLEEVIYLMRTLDKLQASDIRHPREPLLEVLVNIRDLLAVIAKRL